MRCETEGGAACALKET